jgi:hypothetical protein
MGLSEDPAPRQPRHILFAWLIPLKMSLVLAGLGVLFYWVSDSWSANISGVTPTAVLLALLINQAALFVAALRLRATLSTFGIPITAGQAFLIHLRSLFYFFFVPMSVGLEISRFVAIRRLAPTTATRPLAIALLLDRVLGLVAAVLLAGSLAGLVLPASARFAIAPGWILAGLGLSVGLGFALLAHRPLRRHVFDLFTAMRALGPRLVVPLLLSVAAIALVCASVYAFARASGIDIGWLPLSFALSTSLLGMAIPVSLLGASLGELAGVGALTFLGLSPGAAVLLASVVYSGRLIGAMQGAVIELWSDAARVPGPPKAPKAAARDQ